MAIGNTNLPAIVHPVAGIRLGVAQAAVKYEGRDDVLLIELDKGSICAGVFTKNAFCAAPVSIAKKHLEGAEVRYLLVNSGNANACTGEAGMKAAHNTCEQVAIKKGIKAEQVLPFSTGVIGELLPAERINASLPVAFSSLHEENWLIAARAIMTTDTRPKVSSLKLALSCGEVVVTGIAKGAGMINPNMGTMLAYIGTDVKISQALLDKISRHAAGQSFNRITIDGDTSTNDACVLMATGASSIEVNDENSEDFSVLMQAITEVYQSLALEIVRDGEGATKCVKVEVSGGASAQESLDVAYSVCHSPLVKTALFASDPNWGRIVCAIGYTDIAGLDASLVNVWLDDVLIVKDGGRADAYTEQAGQAVFDQQEFSIRIDLGRGEHTEHLWTSDLSHEYVRINAEYRS